MGGDETNEFSSACIHLSRADSQVTKPIYFFITYDRFQLVSFFLNNNVIENARASVLVVMQNDFNVMVMKFSFLLVHL